LCIVSALIPQGTENGEIMLRSGARLGDIASKQIICVDRMKGTKHDDEIEKILQSKVRKPKVIRHSQMLPLSMSNLSINVGSILQVVQCIYMHAGQCLSSTGI